MQSTIFKSLTIMLSFSALIFVSACSEEQQQAAKNTADTVVKETDKAIDATKKATGEAWDATKDATNSAADAVESTTSETLDSAKQAIQ